MNVYTVGVMEQHAKPFSIEPVLNPSLSCYSIVLLCNNGHFEREDLVRIHTFPLDSLYLSMVSSFLLHVVLG